jgi:hypothetical protein
VTTSVGEIDTVRKVLTGLAGKSIQPATREAAGEAIDAIDAFLMNVPERFVVSGNPRADAELLRRTQQLWSTQKQMETVEKATTAAQRRAGSTGTGANRINAARQELRKIIDSEKKSRGMPQAVKDKIDQIVVGTRMSNALRNVSKWAPTGPVSTATGVGTSYLTGGWLLAVTTAAAGWIAKHAGEYLTDRQIRQLTEMMRAGNPLGAPIAREIAPLQAQARRTPALYGGYQGMQALTSGPLGPGTSP